MEASPSGLWRRTANAVWVHPHRGFKSLRLRRLIFVGQLDSRFVRVTCLAPVAQRIEHLTTDQKVWGSNPYGRTF